MKIIIKNQSDIEMHLKCKVCKKKYNVRFEDVNTVPLWKFESCSRTCAFQNSKNKFLTLKKSSDFSKFKFDFI